MVPSDLGVVAGVVSGDGGVVLGAVHAAVGTVLAEALGDPASLVVLDRQFRSVSGAGAAGVGFVAGDHARDGARVVRFGVRGVVERLRGVVVGVEAVGLPALRPRMIGKRTLGWPVGGQIGGLPVGGHWLWECVVEDAVALAGGGVDAAGACDHAAVGFAVHARYGCRAAGGAFGVGVSPVDVAASGGRDGERPRCGRHGDCRVVDVDHD